jgi:probable rRNA maturation factor
MANRILVDVEESCATPAWLANVEPFMQKAMKKAGYKGQELSVMFCNDSFIQTLNKQYRDIDSPTDVLSFENGETYKDEQGKKWIEAGDIVISLETLPKNAAYFEVDQNDELKRLLVHGMLHLNGLDHGDEHVEKNVEPVCEMLKTQKKILDALAEENVIG